MAASPSWLFRTAHRIGFLSATARLTLSLALAVVVFFVVPAELRLVGRLVAAWNTLAFTSLLLVWTAILTADAEHIRVVASDEDPGRRVTFIFIIVAANSSLLAVVLLWGAMHRLPERLIVEHAALAIAAVAMAWALLHTVFTLRYAHLYYAPMPDGEAEGLEFPGSFADPDYLDFAYFAFVIGMTAQTADIGISGRNIRRMALLHGLLSFLFNTAIVALSISGLAGIL